MAMVVLKDGRKKIVDAKTGGEMWLVWKKEKQGSAEQQAFVRYIKEMHLNPNSKYTPESYIKEKQAVLIDMEMIKAPEREEPWYYK